MECPFVDVVRDRNKAQYGEIDCRENLYAIERSGFDPHYLATIQEQAASVACLLLNNCLKKIEDGFQLNHPEILAKKKIAVPLYRKNESALQPLGNEVRFSQEPAPGLGTAFYIGNRLLLTAAHCVCEQNSSILSEKMIRSIRLVFGFRMNDEKQAQSSFHKDEVYEIRQVIAHQYTRGFCNRDWALLEVDRDIIGRISLKIDFLSRVSSKIQIYMLGHPMGLPLKYTGNGCVKRSYEEEPHFNCSLDAFRGNSGSAVFDGRTQQVVGLLFEGNQDYEWVKEGTKKVVKEYQVKKGDSYEKCQRMSSLFLVRNYMAALSEDPFAKCSLGLCYLFGVFGLPVDQSKGIIYLEQAFSKKCADAAYILGDCYSFGEGVKKDSNGV